MAQHTDTVDISRHQDNLKKTITTPQALGISFHQIVGGGVVSLTGVAIAITGGGVSWAFALAAIAILIVSLPMASLGAAMPVVGGSYSYATKLIHPLVGFGNMWLFVLGICSLSLYGLSAGVYLHSLNSWFNPVAVAVTLITIFAVANLMGSAFSARIGILIAIVMLVAFGAFIVLGLANVDWANYPAAIPNGLPSLLQAAALLTFATGGATVVAELGSEMKTPGKTIPLAIVGGTIFAAILYILIAIPAAGVLPIDQVAGQPLSVVAKSFMPSGLWYFFVLGGAVLAVVGTMNGMLLWGSKSILAAVDDGWLPRRLGSVNKRFGTPHYLLAVLYIVGIVPAVSGLDISVIATAASVVGQIMFVVYLIAALRLRTVRPDLHAASPFKLSLTVQWTLTILGIGVLGYQIYLLQQSLTVAVWIAMAVWVVAGIVLAAVRYPVVKRIAAARAESEAAPERLADSEPTVDEQLAAMDPFTVPKEAPGEVLGTHGVTGN